MGRGGGVSERLVEAIDLAPTFLEFLGGPEKPHILEGRSLGPLLHGIETEWREFVFSEYDYATRESRRAMGVDQRDARLVMVFDGRWKYIHVEGYRPMLFDLANDPDELADLGDDPGHADQVGRLKEVHFGWTREHHARITRSPEMVETMTDDVEPPGIMIGYWDLEELERDGYAVPGHIEASSRETSDR